MEKLNKLREALSSDKNLLVLHEIGNGFNFTAYVEIKLKKEPLLLYDLSNVERLLDILNKIDDNVVLVIDFTKGDFILTSIIKSIYYEGEFRYKTNKVDLHYIIKNRIIILTTDKNIFNNLNVEHSNGLAIEYVYSPEEKMERMKEIIFNVSLSPRLPRVTKNKREEIFNYAFSKVGLKLNLRDLLTIIEQYQKTGFYKTFSTNYLNRLA